MMTADRDHQVRKEALGLEARHFVMKPVHMTLFVQICEQMFPPTDHDAEDFSKGMLTVRYARAAHTRTDRAAAKFPLFLRRRFTYPFSSYGPT